MAKYDPLRIHLANIKNGGAVLTFKQIENIIGDTLPRSAYYLRQFWENSRSPARRHVQAAAWLSAGWEVDKVHFQEQKVTFRRS